jgi:hypothetical protein
MVLHPVAAKGLVRTTLLIFKRVVRAADAKKSALGLFRQPARAIRMPALSPLNTLKNHLFVFDQPPFTAQVLGNAQILGTTAVDSRQSTVDSKVLKIFPQIKACRRIFGFWGWILLMTKDLGLAFQLPC